MSSGTERSADPGFGRAQQDAAPEHPATTGQPPALSRTSRLLAWAAIVAVFVALRVPFVSTPLERDEGAYAYIAQRALHGDVPYRDAFDHKPPGVFLIYLTFFLTMGQSVESIHLGMYVWTLAAVALLCRLVSRRFGAGAGLTAAMALAITTIDPSFLGNAANTEIFMIVPLTGAMLCLLPPRGELTRWRLLSTGALGAAGFWLKPVAVTNVLFLVVWVVYLNLSEATRRSPAKLAGELGWLALGGAAATAPVLVYFAVQGAWAPFVYCVFTFNSIYATLLAPPVRLVPLIFWASFRTMIAPLWPFMTLAVVGVVGLRRRVRRDQVLLIGWLVFSFAGVCFGGYFREHYFVQVLPAVSAIVGVGMVWLLCRLAEGRLARFTGAACLAILCVMVSVPVVANRAMLFARNPAVIARLIYGYNPFDYSAAIADEVKRGTSPSDTVLVIGSEPQILFYADRRSATRYIYLSPLAVAPFGGLQAELDATLREVERSRPKMVVDVTRIPTSLLAGPKTNLQFFDSLYRTLGAQGVRPASFFMPVATRMVGAGDETFRVVEPYAVLERERVQQKWVSGVLVLRRPESS